MGALPAVFAGVAILGGLGQGILQAKGAKEAAEAEASSAEFNRIQTLQIGRAEERRIRRLNRRRLGAQRAALATSGLRVTGSPLQRLADNAAELELNAANVGIQTRNRAFLLGKRRDVALRTGKRRATAALIGGVTGGLGQAASFFGPGGGR